MIKKQGVTLTTVVVTVIVLSILAGVVIFSTNSTIGYAKLSTWATEITYIQETVDEQIKTESSLPYTTDFINIDTSSLTSEQLDKQFKDENIENQKLELNVINLGKLKITNTNYGNLTSLDDVYAYSLTTGKVYYAKGIEIDGVKYYGLTEELRNRFKLQSANNALYSIVFSPSVIGYTNKPITVTVKVPVSFTSISIVTSNEQIQVGSPTNVNNMNEYMVNTNLVDGNYEITVSYSFENNTYTSKYVVNSYDVTKPIINPVEFSNIVITETKSGGVEYLNNVFATDESGIKVLKYSIEEVAEDKAEEYFKDKGFDVNNKKINLDKGSYIYTIYSEDKAGNFSVLTFDKRYLMPDSWKDSVRYIENTVPIPKGFVASPYDGENKKSNGLVIYQLTEDEIKDNLTVLPTETQQTSWTSRNQYVWVPVDDFTKFVRSSNPSNVLGSGTWEIVLNKTTNMPEKVQSAAYVTEITPTGGITNTLSEVQAMYESVKKYGGFYIGRYEAGVENLRTEYGADGTTLPRGENVYSQMNKYPYTYIGWTWNDVMDVDTDGAVEVARSIYPVNNIQSEYKVVSTLTYGVQWDYVLSWWKAKGAVTSVSSSTSYGNYRGHSITSYTNLNDGAKYSKDDGNTFLNITASFSKSTTDEFLFTTGALKAAKVLNIYDMAGNVQEWTMEGYNTASRVIRGWAFDQSSDNYRTINNYPDVSKRIMRHPAAKEYSERRNI